MAVERYTVEQLIKAAEDQFGLPSLMARQLGCSSNTVRNYIRRYPTLRQVVDDQRESLVDRAELSLRGAVNSGEQWAVTLVLKTLGKSRGYVERQEVTGAENGPIRVTLVGDDPSRD
jgi:hypothetical protein